MLTCLYDVVGYASLGPICLGAFHHASCLYPHPYMLRCLNPCFHHVYMLVFTCSHAYNHLRGGVPRCWVAPCVPFPFFCFVWQYAYHACLCHPLAFYASLHACFHVHAWVLLASVSSMLQHNEVMDIQSKPTFVPRGRHLLFICLFVRLLSCLLVHLACLISCHMQCLPYLPCLFALRPFAIIYAFSFHCLSADFLVFAFACTHMEQGRTKLGHDLLGTSKKGTNKILLTLIVCLSISILYTINNRILYLSFNILCTKTSSHKF